MNFAQRYRYVECSVHSISKQQGRISHIAYQPIFISGSYPLAITVTKARFVEFVRGDRWKDASVLFHDVPFFCVRFSLFLK